MTLVPGVAFGAPPVVGAPPVGWPAFGFVFTNTAPSPLEDSDVWVQSSNNAAYPNNYANNAGDNLDAGWVGTMPGVFGTNTGDAPKRVFGYVAQGSGTSISWRMDVPAGTYMLTTAAGANAAGRTISLDVIQDGASVHSYTDTPISTSLLCVATDGTEVNTTTFYADEAAHSVILPAMASSGYIQCTWTTSTTFVHGRSIRLERQP